MSESKLLPCPFCGGDASIEESELLSNVRKSVGCGTEDCQGYQSTLTFATKREAIAAWNTRAEIPKEPTDAELLLEYHEQQKEWWRTNENDPHNISTALYVMHCDMVNIYDAIVSGDARKNYNHNRKVES